MRRLKLVLGLSLIANIALMLWAFRQRAALEEVDRDTDLTLAGLKRVSSHLNELGENIQTQHWQTIASNDQVEAFLEEHVKTR